MESDRQFPWYCALAYVPVLGLCCLFSSRQGDEEFLFHARQGFILFALEMFSTMILFVPKLGFWCFGLFSLLFACLHIRVLLEMRRGKRFKIPAVASLARLLET